MKTGSARCRRACMKHEWPAPCRKGTKFPLSCRAVWLCLARQGRLCAAAPLPHIVRSKGSFAADRPAPYIPCCRFHVCAEVRYSSRPAAWCPILRRSWPLPQRSVFYSIAKAIERTGLEVSLSDSATSRNFILRKDTKKKKIKFEEIDESE